MTMGTPQEILDSWSRQAFSNSTSTIEHLGYGDEITIPFKDISDNPSLVYDHSFIIPERSIIHSAKANVTIYEGMQQTKADFKAEMEIRLIRVHADGTEVLTDTAKMPLATGTFGFQFAFLTKKTVIVERKPVKLRFQAWLKGNFAPTPACDKFVADISAGLIYGKVYHRLSAE